MAWIRAFEKIRGYLAIGGIDMLLFKAEDLILHTNNKQRYQQKIIMAAETSEYPSLLQSLYQISHGGGIDLDNPRTFNEKIWWSKIFDATPLKTRLADKYLVRNWIKEKIGEEYLVPLIGVWDQFDDIDFSKLPERFVLKCNHGSGMNIIVEDKSKLDLKKAKKQMDEWMQINFACFSMEMQYRDIPHKIIAEELLDETEGLKDYRFYCFSGKPYQVWVDLYSGTPNHLRSIYDMEWNKIDLRCTWPDGGCELAKRPGNFEKMKRFASILSKEFSFVRIDFFEVNGKVYMGEMTFTPMSGIGKFDPAEWDLKLGELFLLPRKTICKPVR